MLNKSQESNKVMNQTMSPMSVKSVVLVLHNFLIDFGTVLFFLAFRLATHCDNSCVFLLMILFLMNRSLTMRALNCKSYQC